MLTENHFRKIERKLGFKLCPICGHQPFEFYGETSNLFGSMTSYKKINEDEKQYLFAECKYCGLVFKFNLKTLIR